MRLLGNPNRPAAHSACAPRRPFVDAPPIEPGRTAVYVYKLTEHNIGSYWIHSHYGFHHELGLAIPLVVDGQRKPSAS